jgi:hypothetical protein
MQPNSITRYFLAPFSRPGSIACWIRDSGASQPGKLYLIATGIVLALYQVGVV